MYGRGGKWTERGDGERKGVYEGKGHKGALEGGFLMTMSMSHVLRIDNSGWSVNSSTLFDVAGISWHQRKYHVLYTIRKPIINSIY